VDRASLTRLDTELVERPPRPNIPECSELAVFLNPPNMSHVPLVEGSLTKFQLIKDPKKSIKEQLRVGRYGKKSVYVAITKTI
jgi:hypothetical protein